MTKSITLLGCTIALLGCATTSPPAASTANELNDPNRPQPMTETGVPENDATKLRIAEGPTQEPSTKTAIAQEPQPGTVKTPAPPPPAGATQPQATGTTTATTQGAGASREPAADNTANNRADQNGTKPTPFDQGNNESDIKTTAAIRRALMDEDSLSFDAKNTKIITNNGAVVLRGVVKSAAEKTVIESRARQIAGGRVTSELEVAK